MLNILICDDDCGSTRYLQDVISRKLDVPYSVEMCTSGDELFQYIKKEKSRIDVLLMDIKLEKENGIEIAAMIKQKLPGLKVIFVTGYKEEYSEILFLSVKPFGILGKPVNSEILVSLLRQAGMQCENMEEETIPIKFKNQISNVKVDEIRFIESNKRIVYIHTESGREQCYTSLNALELQLPEKFLRCHKSFLVNMDKIKSFSRTGIVLYSGEEIGISRTKIVESKKKYFTYIGMEL